MQQIYDGTFVHNSFDLSNPTQYDFTNWIQQVKQCAGDWSKVKQIIINAIDNLQLAKQPQYLPFNKKYLEAVTFSTFFESGKRYNNDGSIDSVFVKFINKPLTFTNYTSEYKITEVRLNCMGIFQKPADKFCNKHFPTGRDKMLFWKDIEDISRWFRLLKSNYPEQYGEFCHNCKEGNPFIDFKDFVVDVAKQKQGENYVISVYDFKIAQDDVLTGKFRQWLLAGITTKKFETLKYLPNQIIYYYTDQSFEKPKQIKQVEKQVIDGDELVVW